VNSFYQASSKRDRKPFVVQRPVLVGREVLTETLTFGPHTLAFIAKQAILEGSDLRSTPFAEPEFAELVSLHGNLDDGMSASSNLFDTYAFLYRTSWEQFTYQDSLFELIPRYYLLFERINGSSARRRVDIPREFERLFGISIEDFIVLGFSFWSLAEKHAIFFESALEAGQVESIAERARDGRAAKVLELIGASYEKFRAVSGTFDAIAATRPMTAFNALRMYPVVRISRHELVAPIPQLIIERVTRGIFHIMQTHLSEPSGNPFTEQFGYDFEDYVGILLTEAYGASSVTREPTYE